MFKKLLSPIEGVGLDWVPFLGLYFVMGAEFFIGPTMGSWAGNNELVFADDTTYFWALVPFVIVKVLMGTIVDSWSVRGQVIRRGYIYFASLLIAIHFAMLAVMVGDYLADWPPEALYHLYFWAVMLGVSGYAIYDVVADPLSIEGAFRVDRDMVEVRQEIGQRQVLGVVAFALGMFISSGLLAEGAAAHYKGQFEVVLWIACLIPVVASLGSLFIQTESVPASNRFPTPIFIVGILALSGVVLLHESSQIMLIIWLGICLGVMLFQIGFEKVPIRAARLLLVVFILHAMPGMPDDFYYFTEDNLGFDDPVFAGWQSQLALGFGLLGLVGVSYWVKSRFFMWLLLLSILFQSLFQVLDMALYYGWYQYLGLEAKTWGLWLGGLGGLFDYVSVVVMAILIALSCPLAYRALWLAIAGGIMALALMVSASVEALLAKQFVVAEDYSGLGDLMVSTSLITFCLPLIVWMIIYHWPKR